MEEIAAETGVTEGTWSSRSTPPQEPVSRVAPAVWATDGGRTVYRVDATTGALWPVMTLPGRRDANHVFSAFVSL